MYLRIQIDKVSADTFNVSVRNWGIRKYHLPNLSKKEVVERVRGATEVYMRIYSCKLVDGIDGVIRELALDLPIRSVALEMSGVGYRIDYVTPKGKGKYRPKEVYFKE